MAVQKYDTVASRNLLRAEMEMLKHAEGIIVLGKFGQQKEQPLNKTDTVVFRRVIPFGGAAVANPADGYSETPSITAATHIMSEGVTPTAYTISYTDVTTTLQNYGVLFKFTSKAQLMYEDDIPEDMRTICGETLAEIAELVAYGQVRGGTAVIYANGAARASVNTAISLNALRKADRALRTNRARQITKAIKAGPDFGTAAVEPAYLVFVHTHLVADIRALEGFTKRVEYGSAIKPVHDREFGACENFRFIESPLFTPWLAGGAAYAGTGMLSAGAANVDVYPALVMAEDAIGHVSLKGHGFTGITPRLIPATEISHANPMGLFGYVGAGFWYSCVRLNENHMVRIESGASDLA